MSYRYYLRLRPPSISTHPAGAVNQECWSPVRPVPPGPVKGYQTKAHGFVDYAEPLPLNEIFHWDLLPDPATMWPTWLVYHYWEDQDRDPDRARRFIEYDWTRGSRESVDPLTLRLLDYKESGGTFEALLELLPAHNDTEAEQVA